jgi:hypothetical protein
MSIDPRRARDPRLARVSVDPRLQRPQSGSPVPPPQAQLERPADLTTENWSHDPSTSSVPAPSQPQIPLAEPLIDSLPHPNGQPSFKIRPLFCVVCASNQACMSQSRVVSFSDAIIRTARWKGTPSSRWCAPIIDEECLHLIYLTGEPGSV